VSEPTEPTILQLRYGRMRLMLERNAPPWGFWQMRERLSGSGVLVAGPERYAQILYGLTAQQCLLETDPGPLDARVP
jgi:hypothetical protein